MDAVCFIRAGIVFVHVFGDGCADRLKLKDVGVPVIK